MYMYMYVVYVRMFFFVSVYMVYVHVCMSTWFMRMCVSLCICTWFMCICAFLVSVYMVYEHVPIFVCMRMCTWFYVYVYVYVVHVCVCVFSSHPFWTSSSLDVPAGVTQEEGHTGFLIHLPSAVRALIFVARRIH